MKPSWILFDLNGTLLDPGGIGEPLGLSREQSLAALDDAIAGSMAETLSGAYRPLPEFLRAALVALAGSDSGIEEAMDRAKRMPPYPDCAAALEHLRGAGIKTGVLTNSARDRAVAGLEAAGLLESFDLVAGSDAVEAFKPDPRMYRLGNRAHGRRAGVDLHGRLALVGSDGRAASRNEGWLRAARRAPLHGSRPAARLPRRHARRPGRADQFVEGRLSPRSTGAKKRASWMLSS